MLQGHGRTVVVISHVLAVPELIPMQIQIETSGAGSSEVILAALVGGIVTLPRALPSLQTVVQTAPSAAMVGSPGIQLTLDQVPLRAC
jgi:hypothetical protein